MSDVYEFEDYFSDDGDAGVLIEIDWDGRQIPFRVKRHLNLGDKQRIRAAGVKVGIGPDGKPEVVGEINEARFTHEVVLVGLKHWPFTKNGEQTPINAETVGMLDGSLADLLATKILLITKYVPDALDPFVKPSVAASSSKGRAANKK